MSDNITHYQVPFMDLWRKAYRWLRDEQDIKLSVFQEKYANEWPDDYDWSNTLPEDMAYCMTEFFQDRKDSPPEHLIPIIQAYKIKMMEIWKWPEWGYKDVKHLKPEDFTRNQQKV